MSHPYSYPVYWDYGHQGQPGHVPSAVGYLTAQDLDAQYQAVAAYAGQRYPAPSVAATATSHYTDSTFTETGSDAGAVTVYRYRQPTSEEARYAPAYLGHRQVQSSIQNQPSDVSTTSSSTAVQHAPVQTSSYEYYYPSAASAFTSSSRVVHPSHSVHSGKPKGGLLSKLKNREPLTTTWYANPQYPPPPPSYHTYEAPAHASTQHKKPGFFKSLRLGRDYTEPLIYRQK